MSKFILPIVSFTGVAAAVLISISAMSASAMASKGLLTCQGNTAGFVVSCCEQIIVKDRPLWMRQTQTSCKAAVVCKSGRSGGVGAVTHVAKAAVKKVCFLAQPMKSSDSKSKDRKNQD